MRVLAISDIHGNLNTFKALVEKKVQLTKQDKLFLLGDYFDRGPDSIGVVKYMMELQKEGYKIQAIRGNHEDMLLNNMQRKKYRLPYRVLSFVRKLPYYITYKNYIFVHAGLNFENENPYEDKYAMTWTRKWYNTIDYSWLGDKTIVHGHTPVSVGQIQDSLYWSDKQVINIDNGGFLVSNKPNYGNLCAVDLTNRQLYFQTNLDMKEQFVYGRVQVL